MNNFNIREEQNFYNGKILFTESNFPFAKLKSDKKNEGLRKKKNQKRV